MPLTTSIGNARTSCKAAPTSPPHRATPAHIPPGHLSKVGPASIRAAGGRQGRMTPPPEVGSEPGLDLLEGGGMALAIRDADG